MIGSCEPHDTVGVVGERTRIVAPAPLEEPIAALSPRLRCEPKLVIGSVGPLPLDAGLAALSIQADLPVPVKLAMAPHGVDLVAEIPRGGGDPLRGETVALAALDTAWRWLAHRGGGAPCAPSAVTVDAAWWADSMKRIGWTAEPLQGDDEWIHVRHPAVSWRLLARPLGARTLQLTAGPVGVRRAGARAARAMMLLALEANARLRLARVSVRRHDDSVAEASWDVVLAAPDEPEEWLDAAVEALVIARGETERALRALAAEAVHDAYLRARDHDARNGGGP